MWFWVRKKRREKKRKEKKRKEKKRKEKKRKEKKRKEKKRKEKKRKEKKRKEEKRREEKKRKENPLKTHGKIQYNPMAVMRHSPQHIPEQTHVQGSWLTEVSPIIIIIRIRII